MQCAREKLHRYLKIGHHGVRSDIIGAHEDDCDGGHVSRQAICEGRHAHVVLPQAHVPDASAVHAQVRHSHITQTGGVQRTLQQVCIPTQPVG